MNINAFIWSIADDVLHHVYDRTKYRDIILPMTVIRRLDAVLEPTRAAVLARKAELDAAAIPEAAQGPALDRAVRLFTTARPSLSGSFSPGRIQRRRRRTSRPTLTDFPRTSGKSSRASNSAKS
jgi:HsdM N-terminal domain